MILAAAELEGAPDIAGLAQQSSNAVMELCEGSSCHRGGQEGTWGNVACWEGGSGLTPGLLRGHRGLGMAQGPSRKRWDPQDGTRTVVKPP